MEQKLYIFGRTPGLSFAELSSCTHTKRLSTLSSFGGDISLSHLGGSVKKAEFIQEITSPLEAENTLVDILCGESKKSFGLSAIDCRLPLQRMGLSIKKKVKHKNAKSLRLVADVKGQIPTGTILKEKLIDREFLFIKIPSGYVLARTTDIQPISAFAARDYAKPQRDARNGMLPIKLAMMMLNIASKGKKITIHDPFCGTGTVVTEGIRLGLTGSGADISAGMVTASKKNTEHIGATASYIQKDATEKSQPLCDAIVTEGYLGPPVSKLPEAAAQKKVTTEIAQLWKGVLDSARTKCIVACLPIFMKNGEVVQSSAPSVHAVAEKQGWHMHAPSTWLYARKSHTIGRQVVLFTKNS